MLVISKPVVPPWNDSSKNLVRDLVLGTPDAAFTVLTDGQTPFEATSVTHRPVYRGAGGFAPSLRQNARVFGLLLTERKSDLHHFFFAPNPRTARILRALRRIRRRPAIQTLCSVPLQFEGVERSLFADVQVALSAYTAERMLAQGVRDVRLIPPCVPPLAPPDAARRAELRRAFELPDEAPVVLFPGDYEFSRAAHTVAAAALRLADRQPPVSWVFACRLKTERSRAIEAEIRASLATGAAAQQVRFLNQVSAILDLIAAADLVVLPAGSTYAKMDLPLVLLEALALGRPIVVADVPPLSELPLREAGYPVRAEDPEHLAEVVDGALSDLPGLASRSRAGIELAAERYGRERMGRAYADLYRELS